MRRTDPRCVIRWLIALCAMGLGACATAAAAGESTSRVLTNAAQLRALSVSEAANKIPVKLQAIITAVTPGRTIFLQDETGGTFVNTSRATFAEHKPGDMVEVEGESFLGRFIPGITPRHIRRVGHAALPPAQAVTYDDLQSGRWHYERVEATGVVRSVTTSTEGARFTLMLAMGARKLDVQIVTPETNLPPLVDAQVRIEGLAAGYINDRRQTIAPQLLVGRLSDIHVESPPLPDPFKIPLESAGGLLNFTPDGVSQHRVRVKGVVTQRLPGKAIFLRDGDQGLMVQTSQEDVVRPGDVVEAIGFPAMGRFSAFLEDAEFRITGRAAEPVPQPTTLAEALSGTNDANLVTMKAKLLEVLENPLESVLVLQAQKITFYARLPRTALDLHDGSTLQLVGVCRISDPGFQGGSFGVTPRSVELLLRSATDIAVLSTPSGWTVQRLAITAGILLGVALVAFGWVVMLRRRVNEQSVIIHEKVQREAALEERHRMAREMHDTLAQSFSGLGFQLDALNTQLPPDASRVRRQLETARQMVRHGQESFRRSLMNLRAQELERGGLAEALPEIARQITAGSGIEVRCDVQRPVGNLPEVIEANLLRIAQECLANAVHHAKPNRIDLSFRQEGDEVKLCIIDDGVGFEPTRPHVAANGHFGWRGIHERAEQIGAKVDLVSRPGHGTAVTIRVVV